MKKNVLNLLNDFRMRWIGAGLFMIVAIAAAYEKSNYTFSLLLLGYLFLAYIFCIPVLWPVYRRRKIYYFIYKKAYKRYQSMNCTPKIGHNFGSAVFYVKIFKRS